MLKKNKHFTYKEVVMSVNLDSNSGIQRFQDKKEFAALKEDLGKLTYDNVARWMAKTTYGVDTKQGKQRLDSKKVIKGTVTLDKNTKAGFEFYADIFLSKNVPANYQATLDKTLNTKTKKAAYNVFLKKCIKILEKEEPFYADLIKKSENIKDLKDSAVLKVAACTILQHCLINNPDNPELSQLLDDKYLKKWT